MRMIFLETGSTQSNLYLRILQMLSAICLLNLPTLGGMLDGFRRRRGPLLFSLSAKPPALPRRSFFSETTKIEPLEARAPSPCNLAPSLWARVPKLSPTCCEFRGSIAEVQGLGSGMVWVSGWGLRACSSGATPTGQMECSVGSDTVPATRLVATIHFLRTVPAA